MRVENFECPHCHKIQQGVFPDQADMIYVSCIYCVASLSVKIKTLVTDVLLLGRPGEGGK